MHFTRSFSFLLPCILLLLLLLLPFIPIATIEAACTCIPSRMYNMLFHHQKQQLSTLLYTFDHVIPVNIKPAQLMLYIVHPNRRHCCKSFKYAVLVDLALFPVRIQQQQNKQMVNLLISNAVCVFLEHIKIILAPPLVYLAHRGGLSTHRGR